VNRATQGLRSPRTHSTDTTRSLHNYALHHSFQVRGGGNSPMCYISSGSCSGGSISQPQALTGQAVLGVGAAGVSTNSLVAVRAVAPEAAQHARDQNTSLWRRQRCVRGVGAEPDLCALLQRALVARSSSAAFTSMRKASQSAAHAPQRYCSAIRRHNSRRLRKQRAGDGADSIDSNDAARRLECWAKVTRHSTTYTLFPLFSCK